MTIEVTSEPNWTRPTWAWWGERTLGLPLRHAGKVLRNAAALEAVVLGGGAPLDRALQAHQRAHPSMGRNDRLLLGTAVYGLARNRETMRLALPEAAEGKGDLLGLALLDALGEPPEALQGWEAHGARLAVALSALRDERNRCVSLLEASAGEAARAAAAPVRRALTSLFSVPDWWLDRGPWTRVAEAVSELSRLKTAQKLCLRVQAHRRSRQDVLSELGALGVPAHPTHLSPWGIVVEGRHNVLGTDLYRNGFVEVQDEGSQLAACVCDPRPNEKILDLCAGAGGKSLALGAMMGGRGSIVAHDANPHRLSQTKKRARRSNLGNIRTVADPREVERLGPYDMVLVDAPCSSSGTLRRNPDVAWRWTLQGVDDLVRTQEEILDWATTLVRPAKTLVYVTCSLHDCENASQGTAFLARHPEFALQPLGDRRAHRSLLSLPGGATGAFRLPANLPDYEGDAFFVARFRRAP